MRYKYAKSHYRKTNFFLSIVPMVLVPSMGGVPMCCRTVVEGGMEQIAANAVKPWLLGGLQEQVKQVSVRNDTATADLAMVSGEWSWVISWGLCKLSCSAACVTKNHCIKVLTSFPHVCCLRDYITAVGQIVNSH